MAKWEQDILMVMENRGKKYNNEPVSICTVKNLDPFVIEYQGISVGKIFGDEIYMDNRRLESNINLSVPSLDELQHLTELDPQLVKNHPSSSSPAEKTDKFDAKISGTQKDFLIAFYNFYKDYQNRLILHIGDVVAVQKLASNTYYILEKVQKIEQ